MKYSNIHFRRTISFFLTLVVVFTTAFYLVPLGKEGKVAAASSGTFYGIPWTLDDNQKLTLSGCDNVSSTWSASDSQWNRHDVKTIEITGEIIANDNLCTETGIFYDSYYLTSIEGLEYFNTSNVHNMEYMFYDCVSLQKLNLNIDNFDTSHVSNMESMFKLCDDLEELTLGANFVTSNVTDMSYMFYDCCELEELTLGTYFDTSSVINMESMFEVCDDLESLDLSNFNTSSVINMESMFERCASLSSLDLCNFNTSGVTSMEYMFYGCKALQSLDISKFDTSRVSNMISMFAECDHLKNLDLSNFNTSSVTRMDEMFRECEDLESLDLSSFNTSSVTDMEEMFYECNNLQSLDLSKWVFKNNCDTDDMLTGCNSLSIIKCPKNLSRTINLPTGKTYYQVGNPTTEYTDTKLPLNQLISTTLILTPITGFAIAPTELPLNVNGTYTLNPTITPDNASYKIINWSSDDDSTVSVNTGGMIRAHKAGEATITATTEDGGYTATCTVTVNPTIIPVTGITLDTTSTTLNIGDTFTITPTITPTNATNKTVNWSSNDDSTVSVNTGGMIRANKAGKATITATTEDGGKTATCHVTVNKSPSPGPRPTPTPPIITIIPVTGITISPTVHTLVIGDEFIITPTITPDNATDKSITWSVSDESVASVDSNGNVTALNSGSTTVTAKTKDGGYTAICIVTVVEPVSVFRLYNPNSGEHFFTTDDEELEYLNSIGWINEGYAWSSPTSSSIPIYRLYNSNVGDHFYTADEDEKDTLISLGWTFEKICWYSDDSGADYMPIYRLYNPNATGAGAHHFTFNTYERDGLVALGWRYEGIGWYGV